MALSAPARRSSRATVPAPRAPERCERLVAATRQERRARGPRPLRGSRAARRLALRLGTLGGALLTLAVLVDVALMLVLAVGPRLFPYRTVSMLSDSMNPAAPVGSVLVDVRRPASALKVGDVLTYATPIDQHVVSHRVISVRRDAEGLVVTTRGDANTSPDPWTARIDEPNVWVVRAVVPGAGYALHWLRTPVVHALTLWAAPGLLVGWLLVGIWRKPPAAEPEEEPATSRRGRHRRGGR